MLPNILTTLGVAAPGNTAVVRWRSIARSVPVIGRGRLEPNQDAPFPDVSVRYIAHTSSVCSEARGASLTPSDIEEFSGVRHGPTRARSLATRAALRTALSDAVHGAVAPSGWTFERG